MPARATNPADLGVLDAAELLRSGELSATELVTACLRRIEQRDGEHSHDGDPNSVNAWVRIYAEDALRDAARADDRLTAAARRESRHGLRPPPALFGVPVGLKDLFAVADKPLSAGSRLLHETPDRDAEAWRRLGRAGMIALGHTHTHEFAAGVTTDQVGNPWSLELTAGGSSGGSAAALAARTVPAATGTDTSGSLRIPAALCGVSTIKPTRGLVPLTGVVPLAPSQDHAGPMARSVADCAALLAAMAGPDPGDATTAYAAFDVSPGGAAVTGRRPLAGVRLGVSPRIGSPDDDLDDDLDDDVAGAFADVLAVCRDLGATVLTPEPAPTGEAHAEQLAVLCTEMLVFHRRFDAHRDGYQPATRRLLEHGESEALSAPDYLRLQRSRARTTAAWASWLARERIDGLLEPTVPITAPLRHAEPAAASYGPDSAAVTKLLSLTYFWDWTGFPVVALPAGLGRHSGLPTSVSIVGPPGSDRQLLAIGAALQQVLGIGDPYRDRRDGLR